MSGRCTYARKPLDQRTHCRSIETVVVETMNGGMLADVCAKHLSEYIDNGWRLAEHRPEPVEDSRGALQCRVCDRPVRTAHGGRFAVHARP